MTLDDDTLQRLHDGELPPAEAQALRAAVARDPKAQARLAELAKLSELFRLSADEWSRDLDSAALFAGIESELTQRPKANLRERFQLITGELAAPERKLLVPALGFAAAAAITLAVLSGSPSDSSNDEEARRRRVREHTAVASVEAAHTTEVEEVDFGSSTGTVFEVDNEGVKTAVVWIADDEAEEGNPAP